MANYSVTVASTPVAGKVVANITTLDAGVAATVTSITATWADQSGTTISTLTRTATDVSGADTYGNTDTLAAATGTGRFDSTLVVDAAHYGTPNANRRLTLTVAFTRNAITYTAPPVYFGVAQYNLSADLDPRAIAQAVMRQTGFCEDVVHVANDTNAIIPLRAPIAYAIQAAYKNGVAMVLNTDYKWSLYRSNVQVIPPPAVNDHYVFTVQRKSDSGLLDIVSRFTTTVLSDLQAHYDSDQLLLSPTVAGIIIDMCVAQVRMEGIQGPARDSAQYQAAFDLLGQSRARVVRIQRGEAEIYDSVGAAIPRVKGALVGSYRHPDGAFQNRLGLLNRAEGFSGIYAIIVPNPVIDVKRDPVSVAG